MFREVNDVTLFSVHFKAGRSIILQNVWTRQKVIGSTCLHVMLLLTGVQKTVLFNFFLLYDVFMKVYFISPENIKQQLKILHRPTKANNANAIPGFCGDKRMRVIDCF